MFGKIFIIMWTIGIFWMISELIKAPEIDDEEIKK